MPQSQTNTVTNTNNVGHSSFACRSRKKPRRAFKPVDYVQEACSKQYIEEGSLGGSFGAVRNQPKEPGPDLWRLQRRLRPDSERMLCRRRGPDGRYGASAAIRLQQAAWQARRPFTGIRSHFGTRTFQRTQSGEQTAHPTRLQQRTRRHASQPCQSTRKVRRQV